MHQVIDMPIGSPRLDSREPLPLVQIHLELEDAFLRAAIELASVWAHCETCSAQSQRGVERGAAWSSVATQGIRLERHLGFSSNTKSLSHLRQLSQASKLIAQFRRRSSFRSSGIAC